MNQLQKFLLAVLCVVGLAACADLPQTASSASSGPEAAAVANSPDETDPRRRARLRVELAMEYFSQRQFSIALAELRNAQRIDANYPDMYNALGLVYMELGERALADENFRQGLRLAPNDSEINNNYGWFLCQTDRAAQSLPYFQTALRNSLYATPAIASRNAGICAQRSGDLAAAQDYLQNAFRLDPSSAVTTYYLAEVLYRKKEYERAKFYIGRINQQGEPNAASLWLAIKIEHARGDKAGEQALAVQLRRRFPESREYIAYQRGLFDE